MKPPSLYCRLRFPEFSFFHGQPPRHERYVNLGRDVEGSLPYLFIVSGRSHFFDIRMPALRPSLFSRDPEGNHTEPFAQTALLKKNTRTE